MKWELNHKELSAYCCYSKKLDMLSYLCISSSRRKPLGKQYLLSHPLSKMCWFVLFFSLQPKAGMGTAVVLPVWFSLFKTKKKASVSQTWCVAELLRLVNWPSLMAMGGLKWIISEHLPDIHLLGSWMFSP